jgi:hypothetical protein
VNKQRRVAGLFPVVHWFELWGLFELRILNFELPRTLPFLHPKKSLLLILLPTLLFGLEPELVSRTPLADTPEQFTSPNGRFYAEVDYDSGDTGHSAINRFVLQDRDSGKIYEKTNFGHTTFDIANSGVVVGISLDPVSTGRAELTFYSPKGAQLGAASVGLLRATGFSNDGSVYCVNDGISGLRVFSPDGTELYNFGVASWFALSPNGNRIAAVRIDSIELFDQGMALGQIPITSPVIRHMTFSPDGTELAFVDHNSLCLYRIVPLQPVFRYVERNSELSFTSIDVSSDNPVVAAGLAEDQGEGMPDRHSRGFMYLFDTNGARLWDEEIDYRIWNPSIPDVYFSGSRTLRVRTLEEVLEYKY